LAAVADDALRRADLFARLTTITDAQNEAVIAFDALGIVSFANPAARQMLRYPVDAQLEGRPVADVCHLFDRAQPINLTVLLHNAVSVEDSDAVLETTRGQRVEVAYSFAPLTAGDVQDGAVLVLRDVTERRALQEALSHRALHDELTGLPNRRLFTDRLDHALDRSLSNGASHAVLFIDCDRFKLVNDTFGHLIGDQLLVQLSERLLRVARASDTVARLSGDEFILLFEDCSDISRVSELAYEAGSPNSSRAGRPVSVTASCASPRAWSARSSGTRPSASRSSTAAAQFASSSPGQTSLPVAIMHSPSGDRSEAR